MIGSRLLITTYFPCYTLMLMICFVIALCVQRREGESVVGRRRGVALKLPSRAMRNEWLKEVSTLFDPDTAENARVPCNVYHVSPVSNIFLNFLEILFFLPKFIKRSFWSGRSKLSLVIVGVAGF